MSDYATGCPAEVTPSLFKRFTGYIGWTALFEEDPMLSKLHGRWMQFHDGMDWKHFEQMREMAYRSRKAMGEEAYKTSIREIRNLAGNIHKNLIIGGEREKIGRLSNAMAGGDFPKELVDVVTFIEDSLRSSGYNNAYKIFMDMSDAHGLPRVLDTMNSSFKYPFLLDSLDPLYPPGELRNHLLKLGEGMGMKPKRALRFQEDILGDPLLGKGRGQWVGASKSLYSNLKYSPITAPVGGTIQLLNNSILGTTVLLGKRRGLEGLMKSNAIDYVMDELKVLSSEKRAQGIYKNWVDQDGKNFFNRYMEKIFSVFPDSDVGDAARTIFQGGIHNIRDIGVENTVKRTAIAEALAKHGITADNAPSFIKAVQEGIIDPDFLTKLSSDAHLNWKRFFTVGKFSTLNRNRFSRRWLVNTLQNYVINKTDNVWTGIKKFQKDMMMNPKRTRGEFGEYLMTDNQELRSVINNILVAAKAGIYIDAMTEGHDGEDDTSRTWKYVTTLSDYLSSLRATFFFRYATAPIRGINSYYDYTSATGQPEEIMEGVYVSTLNTLSERVSFLFREGKVLNILTDSALAYLKTGEVDFTKEVAKTDLEKIIDGMGRFSLLPGIDSFGQKGIPSKDDMVGRFLLEYPDFNNAAKEYQRVRNVGKVEQILKDPKTVLMNSLFNFPLISSFWKASDKNPTGQFTEASLKMLTREIDNNPTMKKIRNGEFPEEILDNEKIVNSLYSELTSHDYRNKKFIGEGKNLLSTYGLTEQEEEVFVMNIIKGLGTDAETFDRILKSDRDKAYIVKAMAAAEASEPGSSKIVLGYLANKSLYEKKKAIFGKGVSNQDVDPGIEAALRKEVVEDLYPYMYFADKTARYKLAREYISDYKPELFENLKSDPALAGFVNSLGFLDMIYRGEASKGDVDAEYIKNIFNVTAKYVNDPELRTKLVTNSLNTISQLELPTQTQKQLMRMGVLAANINHYDKMKKDPIMSVVYEDDIELFEKTIWGVHENLNLVGIDGMNREMNDLAHKQYYGGTGRRYQQNANYSNNNRVANQLRDGFDKMYNPVINGKPDNLDGPIKAQPMPVTIRIPSPKEYNLLYRVYHETYQAVSKSLTKKGARKSPGEGLEGHKFGETVRRRTDKYKSSGTRIPKSKSKPTSKAVKTGLPGG